MQEPTSFDFQPEGQMAPAGPARPPMPGSYQFSADELKVLRECNTESFFQRCVPIATALGLGTYYAVQSGYLKGNPRFGAAPKMTLAVIVGYFTGKLSYQQACAEKLMALPSSYVGKLLRDRKEGRITGPIPTQPGTLLGVTPGDIYSDAGPGSALNLDTDRPSFTEDPYRQDQALPNQESELAVPRPNLSYDDLRRQNRTQYNDTKQDPYRMDPNLVPPISRSPQPSTPSNFKPATNKYGDVVE